MPNGSVVHSVRRGHAPNCSATGAVVGAALLTAAATGIVVNAFADRLTRWLDDRDPDPRPPVRVRAEAGGALLAWAMPPAVLSVGADTARAALAAGAVQVGPAVLPVLPVHTASAPIEVHLSLGTRCPVRCDGCYLDAGPDGDPGPDDVAATLADLAAAGVFEVAFGGGENLVRPDLLPLGREARRLGLVPNLTTSGFGLTPALAAALAPVFGQVNVSLDGLGDAYRAIRGYDGARVATAAIRSLVDAGVRVGVNTVVARPNVDALDALGDTLAGLGVTEWQWLRMKPQGRGRDTYAALALLPEQAEGLLSLALRVEERTGLVVRWDCAMVPFLAAHGVPPENLAALAVDGCPGGRSLLARGADGRWAPCSFVAGDSGGSVAVAWATDPTLARWRSRPLPPPCRSCPWSTVCGSGCRVVAGHLTGDPFAADPECPRVRAWTGATA